MLFQLFVQDVLYKTVRIMAPLFSWWRSLSLSVLLCSVICSEVECWTWGWSPWQGVLTCRSRLILLGVWDHSLESDRSEGEYMWKLHLVTVWKILTRAIYVLRKSNYLSPWSKYLLSHSRAAIWCQSFFCGADMVKPMSNGGRPEFSLSGTTSSAPRPGSPWPP